MARSKKQNEWAKRVEGWERSGLTQKEFAEREGLNSRTLSWWRSRLAREEIIEEPQPTFVEVLVPAVIDNPAAVEVVVRGSVRVVVPINFDENTLRRVLRLVEGG